MPALPLVVLPHPMGDIQPDEVYRRADAVLGQIVRILTTPAQELGQEYGRKTYDPPKTAFKSKTLFE